MADDAAVKEDKMRLLLRAEMKKHNKNLAGVAKQSGVIDPLDYAIFMDHGYRGLYGGLGMRDIRERKRLKPKQQVLDHMGSTELAANLFRATQTEEKLRRENVRNKDHANRIHNEVGRKVRKTIHELGGTMPENRNGLAKDLLFRHWGCDRMEGCSAAAEDSGGFFESGRLGLFPVAGGQFGHVLIGRAR